MQWRSRHFIPWFRRSRFDCLRIARVTSSEALTMSKNNLWGITLVRGPIWGILSYLNNLLLLKPVSSVISLITSPTSGLARSVFMTRSTFILFPFYSTSTKSLFKIYKTFSFPLKLSRLGRKLILQWFLSQN